MPPLSPTPRPGSRASSGSLNAMTTQRPADQAAAERAVRELLSALGYDADSERFALTPARVVTALRELTEPAPLAVSTFPNTDGYDDLVVMRDIAFVSLCEHHLLPFRGVAHVGYLPGEKIAGLSALAHAVEHYARAATLQEDLTARIADRLQADLGARAVGVVTVAEHQCVTIRGVRAAGTSTLMQAFRGAERDDAALRRALS